MLFRLLRRRFKAAYEAEAEGEGLGKRNHIKRTNKGCTWGRGGGTYICKIFLCTIFANLFPACSIPKLFIETIRNVLLN